MINYLNILEIWDVVENGYTPTYTTIVATESTSDITFETPDSKATKKENDIAVNVIYNLVHESVASLFGSIISAKKMWDALVNRYEGNTKIKRTKITGLEANLKHLRLKMVKALRICIIDLCIFKMNLPNWENRYLTTKL